MVTCRIRHISDLTVEKQYFGEGAHQRYCKRVLLPFSDTKIDRYLEQRAKAAADSATEASTLTSAPPCLPATRYQNVLAGSSALKAMVRNPFILRLFVEALPQLQAEAQRAGQTDLGDIKRFDIYQAFVTQWFGREVQRLSERTRALLGGSVLHGAGSSATGPTTLDPAQSFARYAMILANAMYQQDSLSVCFDEVV